MTTANCLAADSQMECTNPTLAQHLRLCTQQSLVARRASLPYAVCVYNMPLHSSTRWPSEALVCTEAPVGKLALDLGVGRQSHLEAPAGLTGRLASTRECRSKAQERQARTFDKRGLQLHLSLRACLSCAWRSQSSQEED